MNITDAFIIIDVMIKIIIIDIDIIIDNSD